MKKIKINSHLWKALAVLLPDNSFNGEAYKMLPDYLKERFGDWVIKTNYKF